MATRSLSIVKSFMNKPLKMGATKNSVFWLPNTITQTRNRVTTDTGAFLPKPQKTSFGILRVLLTVLPGLYVGATISKECAAFLEENDIFVPDEDDDED